MMDDKDHCLAVVMFPAARDLQSSNRWALICLGFMSIRPRHEDTETGLRVEHLGMHVPGQNIRLDLYRLICYFHSSEYLAQITDMGDFCPWQGLRDEFQDSEIMRILLQTSIAMRFIGHGHADEKRQWKEGLEAGVGLLFRDVSRPDQEPLPLREACNKIIHGKNIVAESNGEGNPYVHFIKPRIFCYEDFRKKKGWKAEIDVLRFVEACDAIAEMFA
jgi:hypothetical protein